MGKITIAVGKYDNKCLDRHSLFFIVIVIFNFTCSIYPFLFNIIFIIIVSYFKLYLYEKKETNIT